MEKINLSLFADDDSNFVRAIADDLKHVFIKHNVQFEIFMSFEEVKKHLPQALDSYELQMAILDLWFIDKEKNENKENEGFEIFELLRKLWPNCYVIFLSNHLNNGITEKLTAHKNIAIIEKSISTSKLLGEIEDTLKTMNL